MRIEMTRAIYKIKKTYPEMIKLHEKEIRNHTQLVKNFTKKADNTKKLERKTIYLLEANRNIEHRKGHERMVRILRELI